MNILVVATDDLDDRELIERTLDRLTLRLYLPEQFVMTFGCRGPNKIIHKWCWRNLVPYCIYHPWKNRKKTRRERMMAFERANAFVAFWDCVDEDVEGFIRTAHDNWITRIKVVKYL